MATISNTPRPGYAWDATDNVWYPIGTGTHSHSDYITQATAISPTLVDAKGDIIAASAADTVARLAVGSNDQVLTADSSTATGLKWATPAAGSMTLISTTTLSGSSISLSSIPQTYNSLYLVIRNFLPATDSAPIDMRFNGDTGTRYASTTFSNSGAVTFNKTSARISSNNDNAVGSGLITVLIPDYTNTTTWKQAQVYGLTVDATTTTSFRFWTNLSTFNQTGAISSIGLGGVNPGGTDEFGSGNFTSGTVLLYGVK